MRINGLAWDGNRDGHVMSYGMDICLGRYPHFGMRSALMTLAGRSLVCGQMYWLHDS